MRRVLVVSHRFPPHGGGGVQRTTYFVRFLRDFGWSPHVLSGPLGGRKLVDRELLDQVPASVSITRTRQIDSRQAFRVADRIGLGSALRAMTPTFPYMMAGWIPPAILAGARLLREQDFDLIYSSAYPIASHVVAARLSASTRLPWVADCRDEWSLRPMVRWPSRWHRQIARRLDGYLIGRADRVVTTSPAHTSNLSREFGDAEGDPAFVTITNGFSAEDFAGPRPDRSDPVLRDRFLLTHVGSVFEWRGAGAVLDAVDRLVRSGRTPRLTIHFVGRTSQLGYEHLTESGHMRASGYVSHAEAVAHVRTADVLLLINTEETNIPGKTWEYLASGRPVLAAVRTGPTADAIREHDAGPIVEPDDSRAIERTILRLYQRWERGDLAANRGLGSVVNHERRNLTRKLAELFDVVLAGSTGERGAAEPASSRVL